MADSYPIRPLFWTQTHSLCVPAKTQLAIGSQPTARRGLRYSVKAKINFAPLRASVPSVANKEAADEA